MIDANIKDTLVKLTAKTVAKKTDAEWKVFQEHIQQRLLNTATSGAKQYACEFEFGANGIRAHTLLTDLGFAVDQRRNPNTGGEIVTVRWF